MTIDSIGGQRSNLADVSSKKTVSTTEQQAFERQLNAAQPQNLVDQAGQALVNGKPKMAARLLGVAAQKIGGSDVVVKAAGDYKK